MPFIFQQPVDSSKIAIVSNGQSYSYAQLFEKSATIASSLLGELTDLAENRIAFLIDPSFEYVTVQWAIWRAGGVAVPVSPAHPADALSYTINDTAAEVVICSEKYKERFEKLVVERPFKLIMLEELTLAEQKPLPQVAISRNAMILYTSGTTSLPKGVVTTHFNIKTQIETLVNAWEWQADDAIVSVLPLHHVHGIINILGCAMYVGATVYYPSGFSPAGIFELFQNEPITLFMAVPTIYYKLIAYLETLNKEELDVLKNRMSEFRLMVSGSAALPISTMEKWQELSGQRLLERYGMTEIGMAVSNPYHGERRAGHIGQPLPGVLLKLVDDEGKEADDGEIYIKGDGVFKEYWAKPEATEKAFDQDGWFITGDIATWDDGYLRIKGRSSIDIIKSGGYKISALEIEEILRTHPQIKDCGVVGLPDDEWGELVACGLVCNGEEIDMDALTEWTKSKMPAYRIPRKYIVLEDLPRNAMGKVTKNELKGMF
jgi:malonyl-CoA/methylmalonyl-CoA synthetase